MWTEVDNQLIQEFTFDDFKSALIFVNKVGDLAEEADHHPTIELSYGKVIVNLTTHSLGKVTDKDRELASKIDRIRSL